MRFSHLTVALALAVSGCSAGIPATAPGGSQATDTLARAVAPAIRVAPYVDMTSWPPPQLTAYAQETGTKFYTMAFVQSYKGNQCEAAWGGTVLPSDPTNGPYYEKQLADIRAAGGDGILSFGGAAGTDIAMACASAASLAAAIERAVDYYHLTHVDFDIEGNAPYDAPSVARRSEALKVVEEHYGTLGHPLSVSYTLPVLPVGMPGHVLGVVKSAVHAGVKLSVVNVMTMDFGDQAAPNPQGNMGKYSIEAAQHAAAQLKTIGFPLGQNPYASIGVIPMIGVNDVSSEIFELTDASQLVAWGKQNGIGRLSFWAQQRDKVCPGGPNPNASDTCSGIVQAPYAFGKIFATL